jgi:tRNA pseudouridine55 synthase
MNPPRARLPDPVHGIVVLDKPSGRSSNELTVRVKRLFGVRSAGHMGTLDPFATGVLVVMLGDAARLAPWLEGGEKAYAAELALGTTTTTLDREGEPTATRPVPADARERLLAALPAFRGTIRQRVPDYSAAKVDGRRRCDVVRAGGSVEPKFKHVVIHDLAVEPSPVPAAVPSARFRLLVRCGPGTYVRQLVADLGEAVGCGAHTVELRRTRVGPFDDAAAVTLECLAALPPEERLERLAKLEGRLPGPTWTADDEAWALLDRGRAVALPSTVDAPEGSAVFVVREGRVRAIAERRGDLLHPRRVLASGVLL